MSQFSVSTDKTLIDLDMVHDYLANRSYWNRGIPKSYVKRAIEHSKCFLVLEDNKRHVGFARVISDFTTFAYLADVFILEKYQGRGLGKMLMQHIMEFKDLQNIRNWFLYTADAHSLYEKYGFIPMDRAEKAMVKIIDPDYSIILDD